jgi:hypothetical protein
VRDPQRSRNRNELSVAGDLERERSFSRSREVEKLERDFRRSAHGWDRQQRHEQKDPRGQQAN